MGTIRVGISGWTYAGWRGDFYPQGLVQRRELSYAAARLGSIEINGSFYSLQRPSSYAKWRDEPPEDFMFSVKGGRSVTHLKRLVDVEQPLANVFASGVLGLGPKLGPVLWQLPESLAFDAGTLHAFFSLLPRTTTEAASLAARHDDRLAEDRVLLTAEEDRPLRHAMEFRSATFCTPEAIAVLREHGVACVVADAARRWPALEEDTSDFWYVRLHGHTELYTSGYADASLARGPRRAGAGPRRRTSTSTSTTTRRASRRTTP